MSMSLTSNESYRERKDSSNITAHKGDQVLVAAGGRWQQSKDNTVLFLQQSDIEEKRYYTFYILAQICTASA